MPSLTDYQDVLEVAINDIYHPSHFLVVRDKDRRIFLVYLNNEPEPIILPFWEVEQKIINRSAKIFVNYVRDKLGE